MLPTKSPVLRKRRCQFLSKTSGSTYTCPSCTIILSLSKGSESSFSHSEKSLSLSSQNTASLPVSHCLFLPSGPSPQFLVFFPPSFLFSNAPILPAPVSPSCGTPIRPVPSSPPPSIPAFRLPSALFLSSAAKCPSPHTLWGNSRITGFPSVPPDAPFQSCTGTSSSFGSCSKIQSTVPSFSSTEKVQVEYTSSPPGFSILTACLRISL